MHHTTTLTELRNNLYREIDKLIETGIPIEIERKGHHIRISVEKQKSKLSALRRRNEVIQNEDLIHTPYEWHNDLT